MSTKPRYRVTLKAGSLFIGSYAGDMVLWDSYKEAVYWYYIVKNAEIEELIETVRVPY